VFKIKQVIVAMPSASSQPENQPTNSLSPTSERELPGLSTYEAYLDWESEHEFLRHRRLKLIPALLFIATLISTFFVGICEWNPAAISDSLASETLSPWIELRKMVLDRWPIGLTYMVCVVLILFLHEMGHFIATLIYRVPASFPIFLPFPVNPIGTLGAVIAMHGTAKNRKQIFDIGLAGPLAGLVAAIPISYWGVGQLNLNTPDLGGMGFRLPLLMQYFASSLNVPGYHSGDVVWLSQLNPMFVAGWVGMLITGFNMMPIGQLDGGHVTYTLFGRGANWIAQATIVLIIATMVYLQNYLLLVMVTLLLLVGTGHPPTRDDSVPLGPFRYGLGILSLSIPILCFPPLIFKINY
jgi:membrane-associated protease RseP (regulator of RpoE activity)